MNSALAELVSRLKSIGQVGPDDILAMRAQVYGAPEVAAEAVEALVALDAALTEPAPAEWREFLAEASVDYVVRQEVPQDYIDDAKALWVTAVFAKA